MKKTISILLGVIMLFTLAACSCGKDNVTPTDAPATSTDVFDDVSSELNGSDSTNGTGESSLNIIESYYTFSGSKKLNNETEVVGNPINFNIGVNVRVGSGTHILPKIATSYSQLLSAYNAANGNGYKDTNYISKYNEEFFVDKAIVMLFIENGDRKTEKYPYDIESLTVSGDTLYINQSTEANLDSNYTKYPVPMDYYRVLIEVKKSDLKNVKYFSDTLWELVDDRSIPFKNNVNLKSEEDAIGNIIQYKTVLEDRVYLNKYNPALYPSIATTYSDLVSTYNLANIKSSSSLIGKYNEAFFKDKAVIFMLERYGRYADVNPCTIKSVTVDGNTLYVNRSIVDLYNDLHDYTGNISYYLTIIEINKSDINNVEQLICGYIKE